LIELSDNFGDSRPQMPTNAIKPLNTKPKRDYDHKHYQTSTVFKNQIFIWFSGEQHFVVIETDQLLNSLLVVKYNISSITP